MFFCFWPKMAKASRKPKKKTLDTIWPYGYSLAPHGLRSFIFLGFLEAFLFLTKSGKNLEKTKKQDCTPQLSGTTPGSILCFLFFLFRGFLEVFATLVSKTKNLEITKKQKTTRMHTPRGEQRQRVGSCRFVFFAFCFFVFFPQFGKPTEVEGLLRRIFFFKELTT